MKESERKEKPSLDREGLCGVFRLGWAVGGGDAGRSHCVTFTVYFSFSSLSVSAPALALKPVWQAE
jgi:hypothetical protein